MVAKAAADMGGLSILVNNAGVGDVLLFSEQDTAENWQRQYEINLRSVMFGCKHAMPHLRASGAASIINISSIAGLAAAPGMGAYNATKAGVWMYTKTVALEAAKMEWNVRVNSVHPVFIKTAILDPFVAMAGGDEAKAHERLARGIPLKRIGEPDDVAYCVLYLASDEVQVRHRRRVQDRRRHDRAMTPLSRWERETTPIPINGSSDFLNRIKARR